MAHLMDKIRDKITRKLIWLAKIVNPGNKRMMNAMQGWHIDFEWVQPVSKKDKADGP